MPTAEGYSIIHLSNMFILVHHQLPLEIPCFSFTTIMGPYFGVSMYSAAIVIDCVTNQRGIWTFNWAHSWGVLGKKYTSYVPIHRGALLHDYFQIQIHEDELQSSILIDETFSGLAMNFFFASLCKSDCSTLTALSIMFMVICSRPFLPPLFPRQFL